LRTLALCRAQAAAMLIAPATTEGLVMTNADNRDRGARAPSTGEASPSATATAEGRIVALDALRGFDMFWIIGGQEFALAVARAFRDPPPDWVAYHLDHPEWLGFSAWDLIMPLFLFVVGAAMPFSFSRRLEQNADRGPLVKKILLRTLLLWVLGMIVQGNLLEFNPSTLHLFSNTLQAIAVGYLIGGLIMLWVGPIGQIAACSALLLVYWVLMTHVPFGEHPAGTLEPRANLALAVDEFLLRGFRDGTTYTWILSGLTFTVSVLLGVQAGHVLRSRLKPFGKFGVLALAGGACLALGWAWGEWLDFPIIKHSWKSSMTLWAAGWSFLLLAAFYLLTDVLGWRRWAYPFVVIGANALVIYVATHVLSFQDAGETIAGGLASHLGAAGPMLVTGTALALAWLVTWHLYRQRIFLRV
jgi:predicted acyltransferase